MDEFRTKKIALLWIIYWLMVAIGGYIIYRAGVVIFVEGEKYRSHGRETTLKLGEVEAARGNILSADGNVLATTVPIFDIRMDVASPNIPTVLFKEKVDSLATGLARIFSQKSAREWKNDLLEARKKKNRYYLIKRNVDYTTLKAVKKLPILRLGPNRGGLILIQKNVRRMPYGMLARRTIGYFNPENNLYVGLEGAYNEYLKGTNGRMWMQRISGGEWIPVLNNQMVQPVNGKDIVTTLDIKLQDVAERALHEQLVANDAAQGCAIVMEVKTGDIKALANLSRSPEGTFEERYNYALAESIEPGSTFKLMSLVAAMDEGGLNLSDSLPYLGSVVWANAVMKDDHPLNKRYITLKDAFAHSSNVATSLFVSKVFGKKPRKFSEKLYEMGLGKPLGVEIPGEGNPFIRKSDDKRWSKTSLPFMSIGYELKITPLQIITFYNAIVNNGRMMKPRFVKEIREGDRVVKTLEPEVLVSSVCSEKTARKAREMMEAVVEKGTAKGAFNGAPYTVAGKTGTAQIAVGGRYNKSNYNASFVGYFPADNPQYTLMIVISNPQKGRIYGGAVAAPVFRAIADRIYATSVGVRNEIPQMAAPIEFNLKDSTSLSTEWVVKGWLPDLWPVLSLMGANHAKVDTSQSWGVVSLKDSEARVRPLAYPRNQVPDVRGMTAREAAYLLESRGMRVSLSGRGKVKDQSVPAGSPITRGRIVQLTLSYTP
ncbi:MAG: penicillin-binding protein [Bacteroidales bacterium]